MKSFDDFKVGQIWQDTGGNDFYLISSVTDTSVTIFWLDGKYSDTYNIPIDLMCFKGDFFIRQLSSVELELW